jgi:hypothetical protein
LAVDHQQGARFAGVVQRFVQCQRLVAIATPDGERLGFGIAAGMGVNRAPICDDKALGRDRLEAAVLDA